MAYFERLDYRFYTENKLFAKSQRFQLWCKIDRTAHTAHLAIRAPNSPSPFVLFFVALHENSSRFKGWGEKSEITTTQKHCASLAMSYVRGKF